MKGWASIELNHSCYTGRKRIVCVYYRGTAITLATVCTNAESQAFKGFTVFAVVIFEEEDEKC